MIAHIRVLPGFWIAVEELERPELRSRPVIMGGLPHQRGTVREANLPAQQCGVRAGMPLSQAHQHCPEALFLVPDLSRYDSLWHKILDLLQTYTPLVESIEMGQAVCDLSGCAYDSRAAGEIVEAIYRHTGVVSWAGIASNRITAQLASTMQDENVTVVDEGQEAPFLAGLPLTQLPDIDPRLALSFQVLGLQTIGQLAALPASAVERRFGVIGKRLHDYARGIDRRPVVPLRDTPSVSAHRDCEEGSLEEAMTSLREMANQCAVALQERHLVGRLVELTLVWEPDRTPALHKNERRPAKFATRTLIPAAASPPSLPIPYRIHSMMAQPGIRPAPLIPHSGSGERRSTLARHDEEGPVLRRREAEDEPMLTTAKTAVRTAIGTAPPLIEQGERILLRLWPKKTRRLHRIELKISQFEEPVQRGFDECMRLDQMGGLGGLGPERRQAIVQQEQVLAARYGDTGFRHVTQVDPASILTERRFRWQPGLRWSSDTPTKPKVRRTRA